MFRMFFSLSVKGASSLVLLVGLASFALVFGALIVFAPVWAAAVIPTISETALTAVLAAVIAQFAMSLTGAMLTRRQSRKIEQMHTAIDSMAQGLCMFDAAERLVVCNTQYYKMYELTPADAKPGATLSEVLAKRVAKGTFSRDPQEYRKEFLTAVRQRRTIEHECQRRRDHASARRREDASMMTARRPRTGGLFVRHQAWVGLSGSVSGLIRRERRLL